MTDSTADPADFSGIREERARNEAEDRQRNTRRAIAAVVVLIIHIIAIAVFIYSGRLPLIQRIRETVPEAILWIPIPHPAPPKHVDLAPPPQINVAPTLTAPITLPPIRHQAIERPPSEGLLGVGRSLACGASSYENLTPLQREQCRRRPWDFVRKPDGTIVLAPPPKLEEPPATAADIMRHEQQTAPPCPILSNVPCLGKVIHGDPLGGGPQPF